MNAATPQATTSTGQVCALSRVSRTPMRTKKPENSPAARYARPCARATKGASGPGLKVGTGDPVCSGIDRKSTRLNSSHLVISYAVFCLKKKKKKELNNTDFNALKSKLCYMRSHGTGQECSRI